MGEFKYGKVGEWYQDDYIGGFIRDDGTVDVVEEYGTDEDFDGYATDVMNGYGYYNSEGKFIRTYTGDND